MCNLYRMTATVDEIAGLFGPLAAPLPNLPAFDALYPGREAPVLLAGAGALQLATMRWGVPPPAAASRPVTNVRNLASPFWRGMLGNPAQRCLVPFTRFCEWDGPAGAKRKVWFACPGEPVACFAGLWRMTAEGPCMAFLTCAPNALVGAVHPKAMPVILAPADREAWLAGSRDEAAALARPYPDDAMAVVATEEPAPRRAPSPPPVSGGGMLFE